MPKKRSKINQEDLDSFHAAVQGTKPLHSDKIHLRPKPSPSKRTSIRQDATSLHLREGTLQDPVSGEEFISFKQSGISNKILRNLRKGQYNVDATLDLHGFTVEDAKAIVDEFLQHSLQQGYRVVLIIHGKGHHSKMPILKNKLNHWLRNLHSILAFCSAASTHGSRGAIYILLKRHSEEEP